MYKHYLVSIGILLLTLTIGCKENKEFKPYQGKALFKQEMRHIMRINLGKELGDSLSLQLGEVERHFSISFNKKTKENTITEKGEGIIWSGTASKYKGLIFLNTKTDSLFQISALRKTEEIIQGLCEIDLQQKNLDRRMENGFDAELIHEKIGSSFILNADKKTLLTTYSSLLLELPEWQIKN